MMTPGTPEKVNPVTSNGQALPGSMQCSPAWYQTDGMDGDRCGSLASSGLPVEVLTPDTTQELDPMPVPLPSRLGSASMFAAACASAGCAARVSSRTLREGSAVAADSVLADGSAPADGSLPPDGTAVEGAGRALSGDGGVFTGGSRLSPLPAPPFTNRPSITRPVRTIGRFRSYG